MQPTSYVESISREVQGHRPFDEREADHRDAILRFLAESKEPLNRNVFEPGHGTGSGLIVDPGRERVLLVFHGKLNRWLQPGGHAEPGEWSLRDVARREVAEEVGIVLKDGAGELFDLDVHPIPARRDDPLHLHFDFRYLFTVDVGAVRAGDDAAEARWFTIDEATAVATGDGLKRMLRKLRPG